MPSIRSMESLYKEPSLTRRAVRLKRESLAHASGGEELYTQISSGIGSISSRMRIGRPLRSGTNPPGSIPRL